MTENERNMSVCGNCKCTHTYGIHVADVNKTEVFFKEYVRMCDSYRFCSDGCKVKDLINKYGSYVGSCMDDFVRYHIDEVKSIVQEWSEKHSIPQST